MVASNMHARVEGGARQLHNANILLLCRPVRPAAAVVLLLLHCCCRQYKVYDMSADYRLLFTLPAAGVADIKLSPQYLLLLQCGTQQQQPYTAPSPPLLPQNTTDTPPAGSVSPHSKSTGAAAAAKPRTGQQLAAAGRVVVVGQQSSGKDSTMDLEQQQQQGDEDLHRHAHAVGMSLLLVVYAAANGQVGQGCAAAQVCLRCSWRLQLPLQKPHAPSLLVTPSAS